MIGIFLSVALLLISVFLVASHLLSSPAVKARIQQTLAARTGIELDYEMVRIRYLPSPSFILQKLTFTIPDKLHGTADTVLISPKFTQLLAGKLDLGMVELEHPVINLELAASKPEKPEATNTLIDSKEIKGRSFQSLLYVVPALQLNIVDGRFSVVSGTNKLVGEHLDLTLGGTVDNVLSGRVSVDMGLAALAIHLGEHREIIKGVQLKGTIRAAESNFTCNLERLVASAPALTLSGNMSNASPSAGITLNLSGTDLDVDAIRKTALTLAGDISPVTEIFTYLAGGSVPQITFSSHGKTISELGDLANIRIDGHVHNGSVSVPEIELDLTEVNGDVVIADGILTGTNLDARLEGSSGHSGTFRIGLDRENDLFQLELMLSADLGQMQRVLKRIIDTPEFDQEIDLVTHLKGKGGGKLILGDSLSDIHARVEDADLSLSFDYQRVPYPINIAKGSVNFTRDQIELRGVSATLGKSAVSGLGITVNWLKNMHLDISAGSSMLSLDELYPWLNSMNGAQAFLKDFKEISGRLDVSSAQFAGDLDGLKTWSYTAAGAVNGVKLKTNYFPGSVTLAKGNFQFDPKQLVLQRLVFAGLDANLTLSGTISNLASKSGQKFEMAVDGIMGNDSVTWLHDTFTLPKAYAIRTPVTLNGVNLSWQPDKTATISGGFSIKNGPQLAVELRYRPEELKVEKLSVKDQYSAADLAFSKGQDGLGLSFSGRLGSQTFEGLFVEPKLGKGSFEGNVAVNLPEKKQNGVSAKGHLQGMNVLIPFPDGEVSIRQVLLDADGSTVQAHATALSWRDFTWSPLIATIGYSYDTITVKVDRAQLCGIDSLGRVTYVGKNFDLGFTLKGKDLDIGTSYLCLTQGKVKMTGKMDFSSQIQATGEIGQLISRLDGPLNMTFSKGVIKQDRVMSTILELINLTEIVKGKLPDMATTGFRYTTITVDGQFRNGKLLLEKLYMDGDTLDVLGYGEIDLEKETVNLELLASPFKTVDTVIKYIPGINYLMGGSLVAIPVAVKGKLDDPEVTIMSPSSVSKSLLNLGARTLNLPLKAIESIITGGKK